MKEFKIMGGKFITAVPLDFAKQFENWAQKNHGQSIDRLNERGGLSSLEFYCVMEGLMFSLYNSQEFAEGVIAAKSQAFEHQRVTLQDYKRVEDNQ